MTPSGERIGGSFLIPFYHVVVDTVMSDLYKSEWADVDGFTLKVDIGDLQVNYLLASQSGRINQCELYPLFEQRRGSEQLFQFLPVQHHGQLRIFFK